MKQLMTLCLLLIATNLMGQKPKRASLVLVGDIYSGESYSAKGHGYNPTRENLRKSFELLSPYLGDSDHVVGNLECAVPGAEAVPVSPEKKFIHGADLRLLQLLRDHRITNVSLANNHSMDYGRAGLANSLSTLKTAGFTIFGAGQNTDKAALPLVLTCGTGTSKKTVVLVGGLSYRKSYHATLDVYAGERKSGVNLLTPTQATTQVRSLRSKHTDAVIVAFPHWGDNYTWRTKEQRQLARSMIDAGADIIIGHGAHMFQELEYYKGHLIVYSLGNFFFLSPGRYDKKKMPPISLICRLDVSTPRATVSLYPINTNNLSVGYRPRPANSLEMKRLREILELRCTKAMGFSRFSTDDLGSYISLPITSADQ